VIDKTPRYSIIGFNLKLTVQLCCNTTGIRFPYPQATAHPAGRTSSRPLTGEPARRRRIRFPLYRTHPVAINWRLAFHQAPGCRKVQDSQPRYTSGDDRERGDAERGESRAGPPGCRRPALGRAHLPEHLRERRLPAPRSRVGELLRHLPVSISLPPLPPSELLQCRALMVEGDRRLLGMVLGGIWDDRCDVLPRSFAVGFRCYGWTPFFCFSFFSEAWRLGFDRCLVLLGGLLFAYASRGCVSERGKRWISWSCLLHLLLTKRTDKPRFIYDRCAALTCVMYVLGSY
jgi:hypothetical protein